jgi:hypothetical protein
LRRARASVDGTAPAPSSPACQEPGRGGARFISDGRASQHARDFFAPAFFSESCDARCNHSAFADWRFDDAEMAVRPRGNLGRMSHGEHLDAGTKPRKPLTYCIGNRAARTGIDFVKDERWRRPAIGKDNFEGEQEAGELAA